MSTALMLPECCNLTRKQGKIRADFLGEVALALRLLRTGKADSILRLGRDLHFKMLPSLWYTPPTLAVPHPLLSGPLPTHAILPPTTPAGGVSYSFLIKPFPSEMLFPQMAVVPCPCLANS